MVELTRWAIKMANGRYLLCSCERHARRLAKMYPGAKAVEVYIVRAREIAREVVST